VPKIQKKQLEMVSLTSRDMDGLERGVFADGTVYLTGRGLAAACGLAASAINPWANEYEPDSTKPRDVAIIRLIEAHSCQGDALYYKTKIRGQEVNAFPEAVCIAVLEYYAFEAGSATTAEAQQNFRVLARAGLRAYVYSSLGYDPSKLIPDPFRSWHERMMLNTPPLACSRVSPKPRAWC
jgi:hypothetical protein